MKTLFKYMPYRDAFFSNFYLRCTPRSALNDPFEMLPSKDYLIHHARKKHMSQSVIDNLLINPAKPDFEFGDLKTIGIVSFSASRDNLLMWSHYADEHRGMVLELDATHSFFADNIRQHRYLRPVRYRQQRITEKPPEKSDYESLLDLFFVKSRDWTYEQEHRLTCELCCCDDVLDKTTGESLQAVPAGLIPYDPNRILRMLRVPTDAIVSVICGAMMPQEQKDRVKSSADQHGFMYREARIDHNEYRLGILTF